MPKRKPKDMLYELLFYVGQKKQYRDVLEACRESSTLAQIHFSMTKKWSKGSLNRAINRLIRAHLLKRTTEYKSMYDPSLYKITDMGLRLLERVSGNSKSAQWVVGDEFAFLY